MYTIIVCEVIATLGLLVVYEILSIKEKVDDAKHGKKKEFCREKI